MAVRQCLFAEGVRYRVQYKPKGSAMGRSTIDIAFPGKKVAVFVDGCFWHGCPEHGAIPKANKDWWEEKLAVNKARDKKVTGILEREGWLVLRFWSHEAPEAVSKRIIKELRGHSVQPS